MVVENVTKTDGLTRSHVGINSRRLILYHISLRAQPSENLSQRFSGDAILKSIAAINRDD
jgi:hypothetical protein